MASMVLVSFIINPNFDINPEYQFKAINNLIDCSHHPKTPKTLVVIALFLSVHQNWEKHSNDPLIITSISTES
ncbi:hypothetical protein BpHYR1_001358 [Brachionus plicatilis]|uniref:Uncharacterized protein n=1 Tax=Brachionus plicatilis TaxID=10195 RepID=A0A3M7QMF9_BRAPC|nr:hypothetical protein BpHYR1_001358 [Brachionus plicatilis]